MKLKKNKKKLFAAKFSRKVLVLKTTTDFTSRVSNSYVGHICWTFAGHYRKEAPLDFIIQFQI